MKSKILTLIDEKKFWHISLALLFLCILIYTPFVGARDLWEPDEPRQVIMTLEMERDGWKLFPTFRGDLYPDYPPLSYWITLSTARTLEAFGLSHPLQRPWVYQLPAVLFTLLTVLCTFLIGSRLYDRRVGLLAALIVATCPLAFLQGQRVMLDPILTGWIALFFTLFIFHLEKPRHFYYPLFFLLLGATWMTKGPVGVALISAVVVLYFASLRDWKRTLGYGLFCFFSGLIIATLWYILAYHSYGEPFFFEILINQTLGRFLPKGFLKWLITLFPDSAQGLLRVNTDHERPLWYYIFKFPGLFAPWILFGALGFALALKEKKDRMALVWFGIIFLLFSISKNKRTYYLLPLLPAASLLAARGIFWATSEDHPRVSKITKIFGILIGVVLMVGGVGWMGFYFVAPLFPEALSRALPFLSPLPALLVVLVSLGLILSGLGLLHLYRKGLFWEGAFGTALALALFLSIGWAMVLPGLGGEKSYRPFSQYLQEKMPSSKRVVFFHLVRDSLEIYFRDFKAPGEWEKFQGGKMLRLKLPHMEMVILPEEKPLSYGEMKDKITRPYLLVMSKRRHERFSQEKISFREKKVGDIMVDNRLWKVFLVE